MNDWIIIDTPELKAKYAPKLETDEVWHSVGWVKVPSPKSQFELTNIYRRRIASPWKRFEDELPNYGQWVLIFGPQFKRPKVRRWGLDFKLGPHALKYHHWQPFTFTPPPPEKSECEKAFESWREGHDVTSNDPFTCFRIGWEAAEKARGR